MANLDRITVAIPSTQNVKNTTDYFTVYHVEVTIHGIPIETWSISKRYKEFLELNDELCKKYDVVKGFSFPKKTVVGKMKPETIEKRRKKLEQFLQKLLTTQLENDFLVREFLSLNNRGISILTNAVVDVDLSSSPVKDPAVSAYKDSNGQLESSNNIDIEEIPGDQHSEIITSASQSLSSSSDLSPHTSHMFSSTPTMPSNAQLSSSNSIAASPQPVEDVKENPRTSVSYTPNAALNLQRSPSGSNSITKNPPNNAAMADDALVIEGLGLNAAIVGERAEIHIKSGSLGNIADRIWGELIQAEMQVPLIVEQTGEGNYLASYIPFKSGTATLNIFYLAPDGNKQPLITSQSVSIMVAPAYPSRSLAVGDALKALFYVGVTSCFIINSMDRLGNPVKFGGAQIRTTLKPIVIDSSIDTDKLVSVHVQDRNDGTYVVGVTPRAEGKYEMHVLLNGYDVKGSPFPICVLAETEPHESNPECCPQHLEEELKKSESDQATQTPISTTDEALHNELKEALSSSPDLHADKAKYPPVTPRESVHNESQ